MAYKVLAVGYNRNEYEIISNCVFTYEMIAEIGRLNNIRACAREIVNSEIVYV